MKKATLMLLGMLALVFGQSQPSAYANVQDINKIIQDLNLPAPTGALPGFVVAWACEYEPGQPLVVEVDYSIGQIQHAYVTTQTVNEYGSAGVYIQVPSETIGSTKALRVLVNGTVMWQSRKPATQKEKR